MSKLTNKTTSVVVPTVLVAVNPTPTELDRWSSSRSVESHVAFENLDVAQVYQGWLESRPITGTGTWGRVGETIWLDMAPGEMRDFSTPVAAVGAGELRFMATASGAGGNCNYTRRQIVGI